MDEMFLNVAYRKRQFISLLQHESVNDAKKNKFNYLLGFCSSEFIFACFGFSFFHCFRSLLSSFISISSGLRFPYAIVILLLCCLLVCSGELFFSIFYVVNFLKTV